MNEGQTTEAPTCGRAAVRELLIEPLRQAGLGPAKGLTRDQHAGFVEKMVRKLAYMDPGNLDLLCELVIDNATGGRWPSEVLLWQWARSLQAPPDTDNGLLTRWLGSVEGPPAEAGGYLVQLYRFLRDRRLPPQPWDRKAIEAQADADAREEVLIRDRIERNAARPDDRAWLARMEADRRAAQALVDAGRAKREGGV